MTERKKCLTIELRMDMRIYRILLLLFFCTYLQEIKNSLRYFIARLTFQSIVLFSGIVYIPVFLFSSRSAEQRRCYAKYIARQASHFFGVNWEIRGNAHLGQSTGAVLVANHQHELDVIGAFVVWLIMGRCVIIATRELIWRPSGFAAGLAGAMFIDQDKSENMCRLLKILRDQKKIFVFPEGMINRQIWCTHKFLPFKSGVFRMAIEAQVPVIPIVFSPYYFIDDNRKMLCTDGKIIISVLPPVSTCGLHLRDTEKLINLVSDRMQNEYYKLSEEMYQYNGT